MTDVEIVDEEVTEEDIARVVVACKGTHVQGEFSRPDDRIVGMREVVNMLGDSWDEGSVDAVFGVLSGCVVEVDGVEYCVIRGEEVFFVRRKDA